MKTYSNFTALLLIGIFLVFPMRASAETADGSSFVNAIEEVGQCGFQGTGKLQILRNSDQANAYAVTVKTTQMRQGESSETVDTHDIKAGGKKHLGCSMSNIMPLTSYTRIIVSETKTP